MRSSGEKPKDKSDIPDEKIKLMRLLGNSGVGVDVRLAAWAVLKEPRFRSELGDSGLIWITIKALDDSVKKEANEFRQNNVVPFPQVSAIVAGRDELVVAAVQ